MIHMRQRQQLANNYIRDLFVLVVLYKRKIDRFLGYVPRFGGDFFPISIKAAIFDPFGIIAI